MKKLELLKKLEYLIAFQTDCLAKGDWKSFDETENTVKKLEEQIIRFSENSSSHEEESPG